MIPDDDSSKPAIDERLVAAAGRAFARYGLEHATLEQIAAEAGISRVTLHRRGVGKDALAEALAEQAVEEYRRALWPVITGPGTSRERLERALEALCEVAEEHLALLVNGPLSDAVFHEQAEDHRAELLTRSPFTDPLERLLRDGAEDGSLRPLDPREGATALFNLVGQTYVHLRSGHRWRPERARRATLDLALNGVARD